MSEIGWSFPLSPGDRIQGLTGGRIADLKGKKAFDTLVRELAQNSLDARDDTTSAPVSLVFELKWVPTKKYRVFQELKEYVEECYSFWSKELGEDLSDTILPKAKWQLEQDKIPLMIASDFNTIGLEGFRDSDLLSSWVALTNSDDFSNKSSADSGGSYGYGKNAPFACSNLSTVFYNTMDRARQNAFTGVARIGSIRDKAGNVTSGIGKYQCTDVTANQSHVLFEDNSDPFKDLFKRKKPGTDVIIAGFNPGKNWVEHFKQAVLKNFFVAIVEKKLEVKLIDGNHKIVINAQMIGELMHEYRELKLMREPYCLYHAFVDPDKGSHFLTIFDKNDVEVYVKNFPSDDLQAIANFRTSGMMVGQYAQRAPGHYAAVVVIRGTRLSALLKKAEPPTHKDWDHHLVHSEKDKANAKTAIERIKTSVIELITETVVSHNLESVEATGLSEVLPMVDENGKPLPMEDDLFIFQTRIGQTVRSESKNPEYQKRRNKNSDSRIDPEDLTPESRVKRDQEDEPLLPPDIDLPIDFLDPPPLDEEDETGYEIKENEIIDDANQRIVYVSSKPGTYKAILCPNYNYENVYISFDASGEEKSRKQDRLEITELSYQSQNIQAAPEGKYGPVDLKANVNNIFMVTFAIKEKMAVRAHLSAG